MGAFVSTPTAGEEPWIRRLTQTLSELAAERRTATYHDLAERCGIAGRHRIHRLALALEDTIRADHEAGRPLSAAVAVSKSRGGLPAPGFFQLCRTLGRYFGPDSGPQAATYHAIELDRLFVTAGDGTE